MNSSETSASQGALLWVANHAVAIAISSVIAWAFTTYFSYASLQNDISRLDLEVERIRYERSRTETELRKVKNEIDKFRLEQEKAKVEIINLIKDRDIELALTMIDYHREKYSEDTIYVAFLGNVTHYIDTQRDKITRVSQTLLIPPSGLVPDVPPRPRARPGPSGGTATSKTGEQEAALVTPDSVQDNFNSTNRRDYAEYLVSLYATSSLRAQQSIVKNLLDAIMDGSDNRSYRVNLYIALTFSLLPPDALKDNENGKEKLKSLMGTSHYRRESTFRQNVNRAVAKQDAV